MIAILALGKLRPTAMIWMIAPMAVPFARLPFSFTELLGFLSLSGVLIKNGIVPAEEIGAWKGEEGPLHSDAAVGRHQPFAAWPNFRLEVLQKPRSIRLF